MRVLDIDLDFFLNDIAHFANDYGDRLDESEYIPWKEAEVRNFLEFRCGLRIDNKVKGRILTHHQEAFLFWRDLIDKEQLKVPFEVIHVDAHADLGLGDASWVYIMQNLLHRPIEKRRYPERFHYKSNYYKFGFGNYLAFAIGCRWVSKLTFVTHPEWHNDLPWTLFKDLTENSGIIQLRKYDRKINLDTYVIRKVEPLEVEPEVPFFTVPHTEFINDEPISFITLCQSPGYTPKTSDRLIPIISEYIDLI